MLHHKCQHTFSFDPPIILPHTRIQVHIYVRMYAHTYVRAYVCILCRLVLPPRLILPQYYLSAIFVGKSKISRQSLVGNTGSLYKQTNRNFKIQQTSCYSQFVAIQHTYMNINKYLYLISIIMIISLKFLDKLPFGTRK